MDLSTFIEGTSPKQFDPPLTMMRRPKTDRIVDPTVLSAACVPCPDGLLTNWANPGCDALLLLEGGAGRLGVGEREMSYFGDVLVFLKGAISRGFWNTFQKPPKIWYVFFKATPTFYDSLPDFKITDPLKFVWQLSDEQEAAFKTFFVKIVAEHSIQRPSNQIAQSSWLRLLLVAMERWATMKSFSVSPPEIAEKDVLELWDKINSSLDNPELLKNQLYQLFPNYNSLRHRFRRTFGASPKQMITALRINQAKALLLESSLGLKEVASRLGYYRHHEFTRAFRKYVGVSPSKWRTNPTE
ncbi:MAG: helix-turn-helix transcriptional regulator [Verrucomicrobiae bacterium]|nr:helix-turn-helix transcriptional regulator [Verrucomicrobiae bacterium]